MWQLILVPHSANLCIKPEQFVATRNEKEHTYCLDQTSGAGRLDIWSSYTTQACIELYADAEHFKLIGFGNNRTFLL